MVLNFSSISKKTFNHGHYCGWVQLIFKPQNKPTQLFSQHILPCLWRMTKNLTKVTENFIHNFFSCTQSLNCTLIKDFYAHFTLEKNLWWVFLITFFFFLLLTWMWIWIPRACVSWSSHGLRSAKVSLILWLTPELYLGSPKKSPSFPWDPSPSWQLPKELPSNIPN